MHINIKYNVVLFNELHSFFQMFLNTGNSRRLQRRERGEKAFLTVPGLRWCACSDDLRKATRHVPALWKTRIGLALKRQTWQDLWRKITIKIHQAMCQCHKGSFWMVCENSSKYNTLLKPKKKSARCSQKTKILITSCIDNVVMNLKFVQIVKRKKTLFLI